MPYIIGLTITFVAMMFAPLIMGYISLDRRHDHALPIRQDNTKNPRYFSMAFKALVEAALQKYEGKGTVYLSKDENLSFAKDIPIGPEQFDSLVVAEEPFRNNDIKYFSKEIYAKRGASIGPNCVVRAIASNAVLIFRENCTVIRWADAEDGLYALAGCNLGISASSASIIMLNVDCSFTRLFAPEIYVSADFSKVKPVSSLSRLVNSNKQTTRNTSTSMALDSVAPDDVVDCSIISGAGLSLYEGCTVYGDVKSNKDIRIQKGVTITGNVFAEGNIIIEEAVYIGGVVFTQESVFLGPRCEVGRYGVTKSVVARESIILCEGSTVYGYVHCERGGQTVSEDDFPGMIVKAEKRS